MKVTVDKALLEQALEALQWDLEPVTKIPLKDGKYLKLEPFYFLGPVCWMLYTEDDNQIRALDEFESGFVDAALKASPPLPAEVPLTTEEYTALAHRIASKYAHHSDPRHIAYTFLPHTLEQFVREVEAAVRRKAGL